MIRISSISTKIKQRFVLFFAFTLKIIYLFFFSFAFLDSRIKFKKIFIRSSCPHTINCFERYENIVSVLLKASLSLQLS